MAFVFPQESHLKRRSLGRLVPSVQSNILVAHSPSSRQTTEVAMYLDTSPLPPPSPLFLKINRTKLNTFRSFCCYFAVTLRQVDRELIRIKGNRQK
jgi:hypothetical protein